MDSQIVIVWQKYRKFIYSSVILIFLGFILYFIATHGFITITSSSGESSVTLLNQEDNSRVAFTLNGTKKRFVKKSSYEIYVNNSSSSGWSQISTKGYLSNTPVEVLLQKERERTFIADNPLSCTVYDGQLISYSCDNQAETITIHNQGNETVPPIVSQGIENLTGNLQAVIPTSDGTFAFTEQLSEDEENPSILYRFIPLSPANFVVTGSEINLQGILDPKTEYSAQPYNGGVLVYAKNFSSAIYFSKPTATPLYLKIPSLNSSLSAYNLSVSGDKIVVTYADQDLRDSNSIEKATKKVQSASSIISINGSSKTVYFDGAWENSLLCGENRLCTTSPVGSKQQMTVFDISSQNPTKLFFVNNVSQIFSLNSQILAVTNQGILRLNIDKRTGVYDFSFLGDAFCGLGYASNPSSYSLCISSSDGNHVLLVNTQNADQNQINIKVGSIRKDPLIQKVIVDRKRIYILPRYGDPILDPNSDGEVYDKQKVTAADTTISKLTQDLQLTQLGFTVINVLKQ